MMYVSTFPLSYSTEENAAGQTSAQHVRADKEALIFFFIKQEHRNMHIVLHVAFVRDMHNLSYQNISIRPVMLRGPPPWKHTDSPQVSWVTKLQRIPLSVSAAQQHVYCF